MGGLAKLGVDIHSLVIYLINFGVIIFIVAKYVYDPINNFLESRRQSIISDLQTAEEVRKEMQGQLDMVKRSSKEEMDSLRTNMVSAQTNAENSAKEILREAENARKGILEKAMQEASSVKAQVFSQAEDELIKKVQSVVLEALRQNADPDQVVQIIKQQWKLHKQ